MQQQNLLGIYDIERRLIPVLLRMRRNGVKLDKQLLMRTASEVADMRFVLQEKVFDWAGKEFNTNSTHQIAAIFDQKGIHYPRRPPTAKMIAKGITRGNPNLDKNSLGILSEQNPICKTILQFRHYETLQNLFLHKYANFMWKDRLYCSFHPLRNDDYGTVSGRFSSSKPNLQQVSAKKEDVDESYGLDALKGQVVRKLFIPEEGKRWAKLDYSQVEYRIMAHYATGRGSHELREAYRNDKNTDFHQAIMDITGFDRRTSKNVNFGGMYGIGIKSASKLFGWTMDEATMILNNYHKAAPYIEKTRKAVIDRLAQRSYIYTILGRKARQHSSRKLHSFFNRLIQGSAADIMKKAMVDAEEQGLFDAVDLHITVHDELDVSYEDNNAGKEALVELTHCMEDAVKLDVPILVDCHTGRNWAEAD